MIGELKKAVRDWLLLWIDGITKIEMQQFFHNDKGWMEALPWYHDDTIISEAICIMMLWEERNFTM